jgi:muramoyltetrapeptide carboxypeptidase
MDTGDGLVFPPPLGKEVNLIFPSSPPSKRSFYNGLSVLADEVKDRFGDSVDIFVDNKLVNKDDDVCNADFYPLQTEHSFLAGSDEQRLQTLLQAFSKESTSVIVCGRGGYGAIRLFPLLTEGVLDKLVPCLGRHRFVGFSDATFLHNMFRIAYAERYPGSHLVTIHGPMPMLDSFWLPGRDENRMQMFSALCESKLAAAFPPVSGEVLCKGPSKPGRLVGGNLTCLLACEGSKWAVERDEDIILILEDVNERPYRLDRMMAQLRNAGILDACVGLVLGDFGENKASQEELFTEFTDEAHFWNVVVGLGSLGIPILYHARIGHGDEHNHPLALGAMYEVTCISGQTVGTLTILDK